MLKSLKYVSNLANFLHASNLCVRWWKPLLFLQDFMALLAYEEPEKSPMFHLLSLEYRQHVAESLNRAILGLLILIATSCTRLPFRMLCRFFLWLSAVYCYSIWLRFSFTCTITFVWSICSHVGSWMMSAHANHPSYTAMERLIQQTTVVRQCLNQEHVKVIHRDTITYECSVIYWHICWCGNSVLNT